MRPALMVLFTEQDRTILQQRIAGMEKLVEDDPELVDERDLPAPRGVHTIRKINGIQVLKKKRRMLLLLFRPLLQPKK